MTLINHNEVKKAGAKELEDIFIAVAGQALIKGQINFIGLVDFALSDDGHLVLEWREIVHIRLIYQGISVSKEENAFFHARFPKTPDNLKGRICFTCARCHYKQNTVLSACNSVYREVNGIALIIARSFVFPLGIVRLRDDLFLLRAD